MRLQQTCGRFYAQAVLHVEPAAHAEQSFILRCLLHMTHRSATAACTALTTTALLPTPALVSWQQTLLQVMLNIGQLGSAIPFMSCQELAGALTDPCVISYFDFILWDHLRY
jgi:hypothetical protein